MSTTTIALVTRLKADLLASMKARDSVRVATLRTMLSALDNAGAVAVDTDFVPVAGVTPDVPRRELSEHQQLDILRAERDSRHKAVAQYEQMNRTEVVARLRAEVAVFVEYLDDGGV